MVERHQYLYNKKDVSGGKMPFFCIVEGLSNKQKLFFMSYTL